ncbi:MAG: hypothetical protein OJF48_004735 [Afipia sp.]|nr:MAG: hypothetical protein OJF48_004735 [Afipia sp.]
MRRAISSSFSECLEPWKGGSQAFTNEMRHIGSSLNAASGLNTA